ncbi:MAG TPA: MBOAT family protein [Polyangia bacterium]|nr:MBOAT family protein [Polyangia bacterium]
MLFNSAGFFVFFAFVYAVYVCLDHRWQNRFLLLASGFFYAMWNWKLVGLLLFSITFDWTVALGLERIAEPRTRKRLLVASLVTSLTVLSFFKYYNFFVDNLAALLGRFGIDAAGLHLPLVLPVGISFYTFHMMSYVIDVYHGRVKACRSFIDYALFVTYFPQLVAGPIARAESLLPQVERPRRIDPEQIVNGIFWIGWGLFKKVVIADGCAYYVNAVFGHEHDFGGLDKLLAVYAFALQIYGDFSGYSDMARGLAKLMGFELLLNFNLPYFAETPSDFWKRWHISLSSWLRDYLYISLGGNRGGTLLTYRNLMLTMLLGGIWHGASWTMVLWGAYHGVLLIGYRLLGVRETLPPSASPWKRFGRIVLMFHLVCLGWLLFRATDVGQVERFVVAIAHGLQPSAQTASYALRILPLALTLLVVQLLQRHCRSLDLFAAWTAPRRATFAFSLLWLTIAHMAFSLSLIRGQVPFIYFQF